MMDTSHNNQVKALYEKLLQAWNDRNAAAYAACFSSAASVTGFDGSQMIGKDAILKTISTIFADHPTARYISIIEEIRWLTEEIVLLRAVVGMVPPGKADIKEELNAIQTIIANAAKVPLVIESFQNTPACFDGRPDLQKELTARLRNEL